MGIVNYTYNRSTSGGEIITHLINASDSAGLHFDGIAGNIDIASPPDLGTKFSMEFILQADSWTASAYKYLVDFGLASDSSKRFTFGTDNAAASNLKVRYGATWVGFGVKILDDLKVHHLVVTIDGTAAVLWDNGSQVGTATIGTHGIDDCNVAAIASNYTNSGDFFTGSLLRTRFWNKTLTAAEVTASYENATVPFSDQYSSTASPLMSGTLTSGKLYRIITYVSGDDFTNLGGTNVTGNEFVTTGTTPTTWSNGSSLIQIGCTADYDLSFSNPTQSLMVQDRAGAADGTSSATGVSQVTKLEQVNTKAISVSNATQRTPANGDIVADKVGVAIVPTAPLHVYHNTTGEYAAIIDQDEPNAGHGLKVTSDGNGAGTNVLEVESVSTSLLRVLGNGNVGIGVADGDITGDASAARTYVGIQGTANRGVLNIGSTAADGADTASVNFTNGANVVAGISVDSDSGSQTLGKLQFFTSSAVRQTIDSAGLVTFAAGIVSSAMPTSDPTVAGQLWNDSGTVKISSG